LPQHAIIPTTMLHPLLHLLATRPQLMADHVEAYGALAAAEVARVSGAWRRRALLLALALSSLAVAAVLAGVAVLLWATLPMAQMPTPWALVAVPLLPLALGMACGVAAGRDGDDPAFVQLRQQLGADLAMLREASAS
jgi:hypothetical protein